MRTLVPLGSKDAHNPYVDWLVAMVKLGVKAQPALKKPRVGNGSFSREVCVYTTSS